MALKYKRNTAKSNIMKDYINLVTIVQQKSSTITCELHLICMVGAFEYLI